MCDLSALSIFLPLLCSGGTKSDYPLRSGTWEGAGAFIQIDAQSMLGNIDSERHFQRDPIFITAMSGKDVSFYIALAFSGRHSRATRFTSGETGSWNPGFCCVTRTANPSLHP